MHPWDEETDRTIQALISVAGWIDAAKKHMLNNKPEKVLPHLDNSLTVLNKLLKSLRGF